jgi:hypothetical protein
VALFRNSDSLRDVSGSGCAGRTVDSDSNGCGAVVGHWKAGGGNNGRRWLGNWSTSGVNGDVWSGNSSGVDCGGQSLSVIRWRQVCGVNRRVTALSNWGGARHPSVSCLSDGSGNIIGRRRVC